MVISYEIFETSLRRNEITMSVRLHLSYDPLKRNLRAFKMNIMYFIIVDMDIANDVTHTRQSVITRVVIRFYDMTLSTE